MCRCQREYSAVVLSHAVEDTCVYLYVCVCDIPVFDIYITYTHICT